MEDVGLALVIVIVVVQAWRFWTTALPALHEAYDWRLARLDQAKREGATPDELFDLALWLD